MKTSTIIAAALAVFVGVTSASASSIYQATTAFKDSFGKYSGGHSLTLNGADYNFLGGSIFTDNGDTATLEGRVSNSSGDGYDVFLSFNRFVDPNLPSPKLELRKKAYAPDGPVDPSTWAFWDLIEHGPNISTLSGFGNNADFAYNVISKPIKGPYAFQSGIGANGKNINLGLSGWLYLEGTTDAAMATNTCGGDANQTCDFNIDLSQVPLPASAFLLMGGLMGLGAMRKRSATA